MAIQKQTQKIYLGCDLGQANDFTALVLMEHVRFVDVPDTVWSADQAPPNLDMREANEVSAAHDEYHVRYIERMRGISYEDVKGRIRDLINHVRTQTGRAPILILDASGVGRPIVDSLRDLSPVAVTVHGGANTNHEQGSWRVPKRDLVGAAKVVLGKGQLKIAKVRYADTLANELQNFRVKVNINTGHDSFEAWREGDHDDLVFALSLCCWYCLRMQKRAGHMILPIEIGKGSYAADQTRVSAMRESEKGGRWAGLTGFRSG
jgi:hypothetical protein